MFERVERDHAIIVFACPLARLHTITLNELTVSRHKQHGRQSLVRRYIVYRGNRVNEVKVVRVLRIAVIGSPRFT